MAGHRGERNRAPGQIVWKARELRPPARSTYDGVLDAGGVPGAFGRLAATPHRPGPTTHEHAFRRHWACNCPARWSRIPGPYQRARPVAYATGGARSKMEHEDLKPTDIMTVPA